MKFTSHSSASSTDSIISLVQKFEQIWNEKDEIKLGTCFMEDAEFTDVTGQIARGKDSIIAQHQFPFRVVNKNATLSINDLYIRDLYTDLIIVTANWTVLGSQSPKGDILPSRLGIIQLICQYSETGWLLKLVHNTDSAGIISQKDRLD